MQTKSVTLRPNMNTRNNQSRVSRLTGLALVSLPLWFYGAAQATELNHDLAPFNLTYSVGNNMISAGNATVSLVKQEDRWTYSLKTSPSGVVKLIGKGKIDEISHFKLADIDGVPTLRTDTYSYRQDKEAKRSVDAQFNWADNELTFQYRGEETTESFSEPVVDRLAVTLLIIDQLKNDDFKQVEYQVFDKGRVKSVLFANEGTETIETSMGEIETIRVRSNTSTGSTRHTYTWFAPSLDFIPVKIENYKRDDLVARLTLTQSN